MWIAIALIATGGVALAIAFFARVLIIGGSVVGVALILLGLAFAWIPTLIELEVAIGVTAVLGILGVLLTRGGYRIAAILPLSFGTVGFVIVALIPGVT
jgi:hypothetical protein